MESYTLNNFTITFNKKGSGEYSKVSYPVRYGRFSEIKTRDYVFQFNLNGEIRYIQGTNNNWPHPAEWLKRTTANDWVYYTADGYSGVYDFLGEYYLPCLPYSSNSITNRNPFAENEITCAIESFKNLLGEIKRLYSLSIQENIKHFLTTITKNNARSLIRRARAFHDIIGGQITVLPPDTRHVDYEVIPVTIADGCLYNCGFCTVKSGKPFLPRSKENILEQIYRLKEFYAHDICNYNAVFLGQHDALNSGTELIEFAAKNSYECFDIEHSNMKDAYLFLFGSVDSLMSAEENLFQLLNSLPFYTYINIGLESADTATLGLLKKPVTADSVNDAFSRMIEINKRYDRIEVTANFVLDNYIADGHLPATIELVRNSLEHFYSKGAIYLSPLINGKNKENLRKRRDIVEKFNEIKTLSRLNTFIYLIQRL